jgi:hypothetical protein
MREMALQRMMAEAGGGPLDGAPSDQGQGPPDDAPPPDINGAANGMHGAPLSSAMAYRPWSPNGAAG